jgi:beta-N-acetylhexosaminidase
VWAKNKMQTYLSKKIAQMFIVALPYTTDEKVLFDVVEKYINIGVGGIMLGIGGKLPYAEADGVIDIEKLKTLVTKLKELDPTLFIAIDGEGGSIFNLFENISSLRPQRHYGIEYEKSGSTKEYEKDLDEYIGLMKKIGINMNFAPIFGNAKEGYAGYLSAYERAYSDKEETVEKLSNIAVQKMHESGITAVGKHFPEYGGIDKNPHTDLSKIETYNKDDALSSAILKNKIKVVMKGHILSPIDEEVPATISEKVERYLRDDLGFKGLSMTDEIFMHSLSRYYDAYDGDTDHTKRAIAGAIANDIILMSYPKQKHGDGTILQVERHDHFDKLHNAVVKAVENADIDKSKIDESFKRIIKFKN